VECCLIARTRIAIRQSGDRARRSDHPVPVPGWLQTSPTLGIVLSLLVIIATRTYFGTDAFNAWAWRIPLWFSFLLVFICRLRSSSSLRADPDYRNSTHPLRICGRNFGGRFSLPSRDEPPRRETFPHHAQTRGR
jgi:hypothetical protein